MGKRLRKSEKLDLILSELAKLRDEVKKLVKDRAAVTDQGKKAPKKLPKQTGDGGKKPDSDVALSKPVLVQAPQVPQPASPTASRVVLPPRTQTGAHGSAPAQSSRKPR
jgi:hypothetical protein